MNDSRFHKCPGCGRSIPYIFNHCSAYCSSLAARGKTTQDVERERLATPGRNDDDASR